VEIYANDPAKDGNTYTQVCQYMLVRPERADGKDAQLPQAQVYPDCYEVHGQKVSGFLGNRTPPLDAARSGRYNEPMICARLPVLSARCCFCYTGMLVAGDWPSQQNYLPPYRCECHH